MNGSRPHLRQKCSTSCRSRRFSAGRPISSPRPHDTDSPRGGEGDHRGRAANSRGASADLTMSDPDAARGEVYAVRLAPELGRGGALTGAIVLTGIVTAIAIGIVYWMLHSGQF